MVGHLLHLEVLVAADLVAQVLMERHPLLVLAVMELYLHLVELLLHIRLEAVAQHLQAHQ
jgi:hypothetical protein